MPAPTVALLVAGTLGDALPIAALGGGLPIAGLRARLVAGEVFAPLAAARDLDYAPLDGNPSDLLHENRDALTLEGGPLRAALGSWRYMRAARPLYARMLESALAACRGADLLVVGLATAWGADVAEALGVPVLAAPLQPVTPTGAWPSALLPTGGSLGPRANRLSHRLLGLAVWLPWRATIDAWRISHGLGPARLDPLARLRAAGAPFVYGVSPWLVARPPDWPAGHVLAGHWYAREDTGPSDELRRFVEAGPPPVYVGFGSMGARRPDEDAALAIEAARLAGVRLVLLGGEEARRAAAGRADVLAPGRAPHGWLLARVAAAVHHGGAGTTHASLRAGAPTVVIPSAADQPFWGRRVAALGAGPAPLPRSHLTAAQLAALIDDACSTPSHRRRAAALGELLRAERGVERAVELISGALRGG